jgi:hypothetical protein
VSASIQGLPRRLPDQADPSPATALLLLPVAAQTLAGKHPAGIDARAEVGQRVQQRPCP